ncbi:MAG: hypothetical protein ACRCU6_10375 [Fusobacteriaceae bacterium]
MKKKLIKKEDLINQICGTDFCVTEEMILLPSAKDYLREKGIKILYGDASIKKSEETLREKVKRILKDSFGMSDCQIEDEIMKKIEEMR